MESWLHLAVRQRLLVFLGESHPRRATFWLSRNHLMHPAARKEPDKIVKKKRA
jgi:hypothetical protein